jgi:S-adenosylmethionine:tRNA ribosyltransferase-isomerase
MTLSQFDYVLPEELIAQQPPEARDGARMLVLHRADQRWEDRMFRDFPEYLREGDCVVVNDSRVIPSRLAGSREPGGAAVEVLLLEPVAEREWRALVRPGRKLPVGQKIFFSDSFAAEIVERGERGERVLRFSGNDVDAAIDRLGHMPLPPYIRRDDTEKDRERYQTVFNRARGSVAAPTAGLHFTAETLDQCRAAGASVQQVTLHVGLGTFQPIDREDFANHHLHPERFAIEPPVWGQIQSARRVIACGTTSVRTIESAAATGRLSGSTDLFIHPGFRFCRVDAMLTNFHLPRTSLLLLVCALAGTDFTLAAYQHAVEARYRFFSYGDCMLIL